MAEKRGDEEEGLGVGGGGWGAGRGGRTVWPLHLVAKPGNPVPVNTDLADPSMLLPRGCPGPVNNDLSKVLVTFITFWRGL